MIAKVAFSKSSRYLERYPEVSFGLALISGCRNLEHPPGFKAYKKKRLRKMRKRETLAEITDRIRTYEAFFESFGFECPLPKHLKRTVDSGFPSYNLLVDAHFMAEMCAGILVAVADYDRFDGALMLDTATAGELFQGMGNRDMETVAGEIVLRDERDIVCVLCQGADEKTRVGPDTRNVLFYAYAVPGIDGKYLKEGLDIAADTVADFGDGTVEAVEIL